MSIAQVYICDECGKAGVSEWSGEPKGWVRLEANAKWDGTNYHIFESGCKKSFCSIKCLIKWMKHP